MSATKAVKATLRGRGEGGRSVQTLIPGTAAAKPAPAHRGSKGSARGLVHRTRGDELDRFTAYLPRELGERLRRYGFEQRQELSATIGRSVEAFLGGVESLVSDEQRDELQALADRNSRTLAAELAYAVQAYLRTGGRKVQ
jgi:hypothetical protein